MGAASRTLPEEGARIRAAVTEVVERVFATVAEAHGAALRGLTGRDADPGALDERVRELLGVPGQLAVGLGLVAAPRPDRGLALSLRWWQVDPEGDRLRALEPDLDPASVGYYDYTATEWFDVPRRTGRRHVVGPYVDVHGTGRYLLTLTEPVVVGGEFRGVVGADVPVSRFETHLLRALEPLPRPFVLANDEDRVVLSTSAEHLVGDLLPGGAGLPGPGQPVPGVPWRLHLVDAPDVLRLD